MQTGRRAEAETTTIVAGDQVAMTTAADRTGSGFQVAPAAASPPRTGRAIQLPGKATAPPRSPRRLRTKARGQTR